MVKCDKCKKEFNERIYEQNKKFGNLKVTKTFLMCPYCHTKFTICFDTDATLSKKKQIRKNTALLKTITDEREHKKQVKIIEKRKKKLEREMKILQTKYARDFMEE